MPDLSQFSRRAKRDETAIRAFGDGVDIASIKSKRFVAFVGLVDHAVGERICQIDAIQAKQHFGILAVTFKREQPVLTGPGVT